MAKEQAVVDTGQELLKVKLPEGWYVQPYTPPPVQPGQTVYMNTGTTLQLFNKEKTPIGSVIVRSHDYSCCGAASMYALGVQSVLYNSKTNHNELISNENMHAGACALLYHALFKQGLAMYSIFYITAPHQSTKASRANKGIYRHLDVEAPLQLAGFKEIAVFGNPNHGGHPLKMWGRLKPLGDIYK